jgi:GTPase
MYDEALIHLQSGSGGNGKVGFLRVRANAKGGPDGGNGGRGGDIIFVADKHTQDLAFFRHKKHLKAESGQGGKSGNSSGRRGRDLVLKVPIGTQIYDGTHLVCDLIEDGQNFTALKGGKGGAGNACFKSSTNQAPRNKILGEKGEEQSLRLKLKLVADFALVGLANAGKSTFLSKITNSTTKAADYKFSTTSPKLGTLYYMHQKYVVADMPGLIEGASQGKGLGFEFLRHIERCKLLIHLLDISSCNLIEDYNSTRKELELYNLELVQKPSIICLSKCDLVRSEEVDEKANLIKELTGKKVVLATYLNEETMENAIIEAISELRV